MNTYIHVPFSHCAISVTDWISIFEGPVCCLACDPSTASVILSGGADGRVCLWQWGDDDFLHAAASIAVSNIAVRSALFFSDQIAATLENHVILLSARRRNRRVFWPLEQIGRGHVHMPPAGGRILRATDLQPLPNTDGSTEVTLGNKLRWIDAPLI